MKKACPKRIPARRRNAGRRPRRGRRHGAALVWFAILFILLLGMVGLVIDGGLLMAARRQAQNAADAAATAAATDIMNGHSTEVATATAVTFVKDYNGIPATAPDPVVNIPPLSGPYANENGYVEVIVSNPVRTFFMHILPGVSQENTASARAVGGFEPITAGAGVMVLNPFVTGLKVSGQAILEVNGAVIINSEGKGVDADGVPVGTGENYYAATAGSNSPAYASKFLVVGGVNTPENFRNIDPTSSEEVLYCSQLPAPDPLLNLPTPTTATGVDPTDRGSPVATNTNLMPHDPSGENVVVSTFSEATPDRFGGQPYLLLNPGIYSSIEVTGGNVFMNPGIYVISPLPNVSTALKITGGNVVADGIMFYNTGNNYSPETGEPDNNDGDKKPPQWSADPDWDDPDLASITINAGMHFSPIDTEEYVYDPPIDPIFDGMLFYQRRRNTKGLDIQGNSAEGNLSGTLYAKWAPVKIAGSGTYSAQFVIGSLELTGSGVVSIDYAGKKLGKAPQVFLVE